ncbi:hypothetical protein G647_01879 [Cladophialophora carrionii CBS 160.54]|uniref:Intradiol ring-cleavage dioxygenases domain-containing protein n=1 Tax=Cladophialophora carrionii CBS 160.54 TaxID=1279043 RepID=V9DS13_9EURO|nr:uncharacterized protein G647_01879 [Cladophialophora carrionii CBS 160.54]ETI29426.1 hypothetical protein G647_01879 [Cladophialophora carrionii CBS 160.54]
MSFQNVVENSTSVNLNGVTNGHTAGHKYDPNFTDSLINAMGPKTPDRARFVLAKLIRHLHDFVRETELTPEEWMRGVQFVNAIGQISDSKRNEGQRICDVLGIESLVDEVANKIMLDSDETPTSSTILGPFWSPHAPFRELGDSIVQDPYPTGRLTLMHGVVSDYKTGKPISNAIVDIWQASANGKYDFQDDEQSVNNLRGKFRTNDKGEYYYYCYHPTAYSLPTDGPAGVLLNLMDRHPMRPAHIHLMVSADGYKSLTTQLYPRDDPYVTSDSVCAVKDDLLLDFKPSKDPKAELDLEYNVTLAPLKPGQKAGWVHTVF